MHCDGLIAVPGSTSSFPLFTKQPTKFQPDPSTRISFITQFPNRSISTRTRLAYMGPRAAINEGCVKPMSEMSFYELLGIPETVTMPEIKHAYKQLARKYHPDVSPPDRVEEYTKRFMRVQEAYETLSDPRRRAMYDRDIASGLHLAFSARKKMYHCDEGTEDKSEWRNRWQSQLSELKKRSMYKDASGDMSWGARMRTQREEASTDHS